MTLRCHEAAACFAIIALWTLVSDGVANAQQPTGNAGTTGDGTSLGSATTDGTTTINSVTSGTAQGGNLTGQGVQQPQFRAFGETLNQDASGFIGRGTGDEFIGQRLSGQQNAGGTIGPQFGGLGGNQGVTNRGTGQPSGLSRAARLRPRHRVAFSYSPLREESVSTSLRTHLRPLQDRLTGAHVSLAPDGTLVLQGTAISDDARELAEALARLEPGVRRVDNQIVVTGSPSDVQTPF